MATKKPLAPLKTIFFLFAVAFTMCGRSQTVRTIGSFPIGFLSALSAATNGLLAGTSSSASGYGTVFSVSTNGTLTNFVTFTSTNANPVSVIQALDGNFYGPTYTGGAGAGTIFEATSAGGLKTFAKVPGSGQVDPGPLLQARDGNFYGTTFYGGTVNGNFPLGMGTVFIVTANGVYTTVASFAFTNGATPGAGLILGPDGNFYGTTEKGGKTNAAFKTGLGTIFKFTTNGALTLFASFNQTNGATPVSSLAVAADGNLYGVAYQGGDFGLGSACRVTTDGAITLLDSFASTNGANPNSLTAGPHGILYGTTYGGGTSQNGTLFALTTNGTLTSLFSFTGTNGAHPVALTLGADGNFYGTTTNTVFRLTLGPAITVQPQNSSAYAGATATFSASASGSGTLIFQWQKDGTNLIDGGSVSGSATTNLTITPVIDSDAGTYTVIVTDADGSTLSAAATLTVNDAAAFAFEPLSQTVGAGSTVIFSTSVYGDPPFVFQWAFDGASLGSPAGGSNYSTLVLTNVGTNQSGNYTVTVFNSHGSIASSNAALTVIPQPLLSLQISAGYPLLTLRGTVGQGFGVQYSTNLGDPNWVNLLSITNLSNGPYSFLDSSPAARARFYRSFFK